MTDKLTAERRSHNMRQIKSKGMKPELLVRGLVHRMGYRFRLHAKDLPGTPDLVFRSRRRIVFVHGCFWHQHSSSKCSDARLPKTRLDYWGPKLARNVQRDRIAVAALRGLGWRVMIIWECETANRTKLKNRLAKYLGPARTVWTQ